MELTVGAMFFLAVIFLIFGVVFRSFFRGLPPGPWGLPILGCWPWMTHDWHKDFIRLGKGYGDVFTINLLNTPVVVLNSWKAVSEALTEKPQVWAGRPYSYGYELIDLSPEILFKDDYTENFRRRKKFSMATMRALGSGRTIIQDKIQREVEEVVRIFTETKCQSFSVKDLILIHGANTASSIFLGRTYEPDDKYFREILRFADIWITTIHIITEPDVMPVLRYFPRAIVGKGKHAVGQLKVYFEATIKEHRESYDENNMRSFIDICISKDYSDDEILIYLFSLWSDSVDTTPASIRWWLFFMTHHPEYQRKAQDEIDTVIGDRCPLLSDRPQLPFLEATMMETLRHCTPVPISLPLQTQEDTTLQGYKIPKGTISFFNWTAVHHDPAVWGNDAAFDPARFIKPDDGSCDTKKSGWVGFAVGKRSCVGETLARQIMFLFQVNFMKNFTFSFPEGKVPPTSAKEMALGGVTNSAQDFEVIATPRK